MDRWFPWLKYGKKRFFTHLLIGIVFSLAILNLAYYIFKIGFTETPPDWEQVIVTNVFGAILFVPLYSIYFSLQFLSQWQKTELEMERFQKESMRSQLSSLKNHLDPHFLFNNLNILSSLIDEDAVLSQEFLVRFAQVYRTMLLTKVEDLITLEEELEFISAYTFLIQTRFENNIQFIREIDEDAKYSMLPPLTIQLLIENAIKHNIITESRPLQIKIIATEDTLEVRNTLFEKPEDIKTKSGTGLKNITERYSYFTDSPVHFEKTATEYVATVPLLEIETI
jgi:LytS/YehU family sensor histidine kinase